MHLHLLMAAAVMAAAFLFVFGRIDGRAIKALY